MPLQYLILAAAVVFGVVSADECYSNYLEGCLDDNKGKLAIFFSILIMFSVFKLATIECARVFDYVSFTNY